ncbi:cobalt-precorrin 5A hydrolase / precorrin-3B C17-methyltransferase [Bartonella apihabitans]|uniref:precorrin-3B C(17)-methyltransferase n=1 Tax=Bartonella apihabitans TaxID=2750929 RepID=UPI00098FC8EA|nr:precorrin-3B C(17)-methyltransferase [Bartonella apihabitans]AQT44779.1 cobalt-precorrin 5A hydrolase / precorrin-3B C17-methyltransferase [Bartonella apihabitans]
MFNYSSQNTDIFIFSDFSKDRATAISKFLKNATIYGTSRVEGTDITIVDDIANSIKDAFTSGRPIVAFCACGLIVRILAPLLKDKFSEPPVLCIAEDGSSVVPLLGANIGANDLAHDLAKLLDSHAAITTSGYLRFGLNLFTPPEDLELVNKNDAASFLSSLLAGETVELVGTHQWFATASLPFSTDASLKIVIDENGSDITGSSTKLIYRKSKKNGLLTIVGLGPGNSENITFSARNALVEATDIFGYDYYIKLASPFLGEQTLHPSDNRQELLRAKEALDLAATGKRVAMISSGDPGIFAMAAAVFETLDENYSPLWDNVEVKVETGITAAQSAAARLGAPLGHDFAVISLSDNLKPWKIIEKRLVAAIKSDMVLALYNPVSRARPTKIVDTLRILNQLCPTDRIVMIGTDIGRTGEQTLITTLADLNIRDITSRSVVIIGSSQTRRFERAGKVWSYTPRSYPDR